MPDDAESGGSNFTEKVTALWPPRRPRTSTPGVERTTVKAHVLAHVARSRRQPGAGPARPELALPWNRKRRLELPLPPSGETPRGSQTTPRFDGDQAPPPVVAALAPTEAPGARPAAGAASAPAASTASTAPGAVAAEPSGPLAAPSASAADAWVDPTPASGPADTAMPPLYAGISPYRHALPATLFELTAASQAPPTATAPARARIRPERDRRRPHAHPARRAARSRQSRVGRPVPVLVFLLAVLLWVVAYWQTWEALSMTERCRAAWQMLSGTPGGPADDDPGI